MLMCISWNVISNHNTVNTGTYSQAYSHQQHNCALLYTQETAGIELSWQPHLVSTGVEEVLQPDDVRVVESSHNL